MRGDRLRCGLRHGREHALLGLLGVRARDLAGFSILQLLFHAPLILGLALWHITGSLEWIIYPLLVRGIGVISSIIGTYAVRGGPGKSGNAMAAIFRGFLSSAAISAVLFFAAGYLYGQLRGFPAELSARLANRLAAWIVTVVGCDLEGLDPAEMLKAAGE